MICDFVSTICILRRQCTFCVELLCWRFAHFGKQLVSCWHNLRASVGFGGQQCCVVCFRLWCRQFATICFAGLAALRALSPVFWCVYLLCDFTLYICRSAVLRCDSMFPSFAKFSYLCRTHSAVFWFAITVRAAVFFCWFCDYHWALSHACCDRACLCSCLCLFVFHFVLLWPCSALRFACVLCSIGCLLRCATSHGGAPSMRHNKEQDTSPPCMLVCAGRSCLWTCNNLCCDSRRWTHTHCDRYDNQSLLVQSKINEFIIKC